MRFVPTALSGLWLIEPNRIDDERGHFARTYDRDEFVARGLEPAIVQCSTSFNARAGTLRGMHLQADPHGEPKLIRCTRGAIFDVAVDLRSNSPTHRLWFGAELSAQNGSALYVPPGFAHGFQTLDDSSEVLYMMGRAYVPGAAFGVRWNDAAFSIEWPAVVERVITPRDQAFPDYTG